MFSTNTLCLAAVKADVVALETELTAFSKTLALIQPPNQSAEASALGEVFSGPSFEGSGSMSDLVSSLSSATWTLGAALGSVVALSCLQSWGTRLNHPFERNASSKIGNSEEFVATIETAHLHWTKTFGLASRPFGLTCSPPSWFPAQPWAFQSFVKLKESNASMKSGSNWTDSARNTNENSLSSADRRTEHLTAAPPHHQQFQALLLVTKRIQGFSSGWPSFNYFKWKSLISTAP